MNIKGTVVDGPGVFTVQELDLDDPRADEVLVRVVAAGMCQTDLQYAAGRALPFPVLLGHEGAGVVVDVGSAVRSVAVGDHVVLSFASCGRCEPCLGAHPAFCRDMRLENMSGCRRDGSPTVRRDGQPVNANFFGQSSFATHALARADNVVRIPPWVPFEVAAPLGWGVLTGAGVVLNVLRPAVGGSLLVVGFGAVGASALFAARACGAGRVAVVEPNPRRRALSLELGAAVALDPARADLTDRLRAVTDRGFDCAIDTSGDHDAVRAAFESLQDQGHLVLVAGGPDASLDLALPLVGLLRGRHVQGVIEGDAVPRLLIPALLQLWADGRFPVDRLIRTYPMSDVGLAIRDCRTGEVLKPVLLPEGN